MIRLVVLALIASCLPPDKPTEPTAPRDADAALVAHRWLIENHVITGTSSLTERDAQVMHGRTVDISAGEFRTPFQGSCDDATRDKRTRPFEDVAIEVDLVGERKQTAIRFGMTKQVTEFRVICSHKRTPPIVIFIAGDRAMTCFSGVCYLLTRS